MVKWLLKLMLRLVALIPFSVLYLISDCLYYLVYYVIRYRRKVVHKNLRECFPEKTDAERMKIEKGFYRFFVDNILEICKLAYMSKAEMSRRMRFTNIEAVNSLLREGRSVSMFLGHYGNWEWVSSMPLHLPGEALGVQIYHKLDNESVDSLMLEMRGRMGATSVEMRHTARFITRLKNEGKVCIVGFIADQSPWRSESHYSLPFLHHMTPVLTTTEKITKHYDFEAFFLRVIRVKRGYYEAELVKMSDNPKDLPDYRLTDIYYRMLEKEIIGKPELYLWSHKRFKRARLMNEDEERETADKFGL